METKIEEIETPLQDLKNSSFHEVLQGWNKEIRDSFMKINTICLNEQQMLCMSD